MDKQIDKRTNAAHTGREMRRTVRLVNEEPSKRDGKARLSAFGLRAVASLAGVSLRTVRRAAKAGELDMGSLAGVSGWIERQRE